jgi:DNA-3-methyladenine glycosylase
VSDERQEALPRLSQLLGGPTLDAARGVLGAHLVRTATLQAEERRGRIVEVEAYIGERDLASHARFGRTRRNEVMYGPPGRAYVYLVYGMYDCLNVVTEAPGDPAALLVRAIEPISGIASMRAGRVDHELERRKPRTELAASDRAAAATARAASIPTARLGSGPGVLCAAFDITVADTGLDLLDGDAPLRLEPGDAPIAEARIVATPRIGIGYAAEPWRSAPWRFFDRESPSVSGPRRGSPRADG